MLLNRGANPLTASSFFSSNSSNGTLNGNNAKPNQKVCHTLPITCQICLGKVKEPCVCPNMHVFCAFCIDIWLEKTKQCPTCRIPITSETPCRRLLGGSENQDEVDLLKPTEFSHLATRKARFLSLFQLYEDEMERLNRYIDSLNDEIKNLKETNSHTNGSATNISSPQYDMLHILKSKLQASQTTLEETLREKDETKLHNKKLESENSILIQEIARLKGILSEKTSQISSKYTMAALESKLETYEKEIKQLQKALEKSDKLIADLELHQQQQQQHHSSSKDSFSNNPYIQHTNSIINKTLTSAHTEFNKLSSGVKSAKTPVNSPIVPCMKQNVKNDTKNVKFSEKIDTITSPMKQNVISNNKFYGSPSKTPTSAAQSHHHRTVANGSSIMSFSERMKKNNSLHATINTSNANSAYELDSASNLISSSTFSNTNSQHQPDQPASTSQLASQQFLFSPLKRLRLDDGLTSGDDMFNANYLTEQDMATETSMKPAIAYPATPYSYNFKPQTNKQAAGENGDYKNVCVESKSSNGAVTAEFIDCIDLLNQAEKKVQNRQLSPKSCIENSSSSNKNGLAEKYFQETSYSTVNDKSNNEMTSNSSTSSNTSSSTVNDTSICGILSAQSTSNTNNEFMMFGQGSCSSTSFYLNCHNRGQLKKSPSYDQSMDFCERRRQENTDTRTSAAYEKEKTTHEVNDFEMKLLMTPDPNKVNGRHQKSNVSPPGAGSTCSSSNSSIINRSKSVEHIFTRRNSKH